MYSYREGDIWSILLVNTYVATCIYRAYVYFQDDLSYSGILTMHVIEKFFHWLHNYTEELSATYYIPESLTGIYMFFLLQ